MMAVVLRVAVLEVPSHALANVRVRPSLKSTLFEVPAPLATLKAEGGDRLAMRLELASTVVFT